MFQEHTKRRVTVGRIPLNRWSDRRTELYLTTHHSQQTDIHAHGGIRTHNPSKRADAGPCLRPRGHWDQRFIVNCYGMVHWVAKLCHLVSVCRQLENAPFLPNVGNQANNGAASRFRRSAYFKTPLWETEAKQRYVVWVAYNNRLNIYFASMSNCRLLK